MNPTHCSLRASSFSSLFIIDSISCKDRKVFAEEVVLAQQNFGAV
jgi:hypothetical protein